MNSEKSSLLNSQYPSTFIASSFGRGGRAAPPYSVARCCFEWISSTNGTVSLRAHDFAVIARPVIDELYRTTPQGQRPDANDLAARLYDALHAAGAHVAIKNPSTSSPS